MREMPLKRLARVMPGQAPDGETVHPVEDGVDGLPFIQGNAEFGAVHPVPRLIAVDPPRVARRGSILLSVRAPVGQLNIARDDLAIGRGVAAIEAGTSVLSSFLWWVLHARLDELLARQVGSTYGAVDARAVATLPIPAVGIGEQRQIADFLDRECERITEVTAERAQQLEDVLGLERVRIGERLRAAPESEQTRLGHLLKARPCYGVLVPRFVAEGGTRLVRVGDLDDLAHRAGSLRMIETEQAAEFSRSFVETGDVLVSVVGSIDRSALVSSELAGANIARAVARLQPRPDLPSILLWAWTRTGAYLSQARVATSGDTAQPTLNIGDLNRFRLSMPRGLGDRETLASEITASLRLTDLVRDELVASSQSLTEYRDVLITEAVTGKLDVTRLSDQQLNESAHAVMEGEQPEVLA